jgi:ClpP class serine protease
MKIYAMETGFLSRLLSDRKELLAIARTLGTADAMREARNDLMASARVHVAPKNGEPLNLFIDSEGIAHIPIIGELTPSAQTDACGAYTAEALTEYGFIFSALAQANSMDKVTGIALDIDSPGGYVAGVDAVAQAIAESPKPVHAYVGDMATSAAYWLASQADTITAMSPVSRIGSIGVAVEEYDYDGAYEREGIAHRVYTSTDAPDKRPDTKTPEGRAKVIADLDSIHAVFVRRVAEGRGVSTAKVSKDFGRGGVMTAEAAMAAGMIDAVHGSHLSRKIESAGVASSASATPAAASQTKDTRMDINQLKAEHPDLVAQIAAWNEEIGVNKERTRREALVAFQGINADGDRAVQEAVASGKSAIDAMPHIQAAIEKGRSKAADGDNPPVVGTKPAETGSGVSPVALTDEEKQLCKALNISEAEYLASNPKEVK